MSIDSTELELLRRDARDMSLGNRPSRNPHKADTLAYEAYEKVLHALSPSEFKDDPQLNTGKP